MKIVVCMKRVPDTQEKVELTEDEKRVDTTGLEFVINTHDECAVEEAIQIKEEKGGEVTVISLGPAGTTESIREALAMGADHGVLLEIEEENWGPKTTAEALAQVLKEMEFDMLLFGMESGDGTYHQVGLGVAERLGLPCIAGVKNLEIQDGKAIVKRGVEIGEEIYEVELPAIFTVVDGINRPRHPSLRGIMMAKRKELKRVTPPKGEEWLTILKLRKPPEREGGEILGQGTAAVTPLMEKLREAGFVG